MGNVDNQRKPFEEAPNEQNSNSFMIPVVLDNLFKYCKFKHLASHRLVCSRWYAASLSQWLKKAPTLKLADVGDYSVVGKLLSEFLATVHSRFHSYAAYEYNGLRRFQRFELIEVKGGIVEERRPLIELFFRNSGHWITHLTISIPFRDLDTYHAVILSKFTPNLVHLEVLATFLNEKDLTLENFDSNELGDHNKLNLLKIRIANEFPLSGWMQLLSRYPKLQTVVTDEMGFAHKTQASRMLESIGAIRKRDSTSLDLKRLGVYSRSEPNYTPLLSLLRNKQLILEDLGITVGAVEDIQNKTTFELLETQAATLKRLRLHDTGDPNSIPRQVFQPPQLGLVTRLDLRGLPFRRLTFLKSFPNLKAVTTATMFYKSDSLEEGVLPIFAQVGDDELGELVMSSLTQFHCSYDKTFCCFSADDIQKLGRAMPNLKDLKVWLTNDSFREVCKCWPSLEHLHILGNEVDDEGISGVVDGGGEKIKENMSVFQELKSFKMSYVGWELRDFAPKITSIQSDLEGFSHLPNLKKVEIGDKKCVDGTCFRHGRRVVDNKIYPHFQDILMVNQTKP